MSSHLFLSIGLGAAAGNIGYLALTKQIHPVLIVSAVGLFIAGAFGA